MDTIKVRNGMDLTETEDIKKGWQNYTKKQLQNQVQTKSGFFLHSPHLTRECLALRGAMPEVGQELARGASGKG